MFQIVGLVVLFGMVFGGFMLAGGHFDVILKALPFEMMMIGGAAIGAMLIANDLDTIKGVGGGFGKIMGGAKWKKQDYADLLALLFQLTKLMKTKGVVALEPHIEKPDESAIFQKYPKIQKDHFATDFICDTFRMMTMNLDDPHQVEDAMEKQLEKHHHEALRPAHALQNMADALPALGIVAAVLGIIKTMGSINKPPEVLGAALSARWRRGLRPWKKKRAASTRSSSPCWSPISMATPPKSPLRSAAVRCRRACNPPLPSWKKRSTRRRRKKFSFRSAA
jgi:chemotaxis protein MotA